MRISDLVPTEIRSYFESRGVVFRGDAVKQVVRCIFHKDARPSLSIDLTKAVWHCFTGCGKGGLIDFEKKCFSHDSTEKALQAIFQQMGEEWTPPTGNEIEPEDIYPYTDEHGVLLFEKLRFPDKKWATRHANGKGRWEYKLDGIRKVLYNLPAVIASNHVCICEGEKDANNVALANLGQLDPTGWSKISTTTNFDGAGNWDSKYSRYLIGKDVVIFTDFDDPGIAHGQMVAASVYDYALSVRVVELPGLEPKGDVSDYLKNHTPPELLDQINKSSFWKPKKGHLLIPISEFMAKRGVDIEWLINGIIQRGSNGFVVGSPKVGKSYTCLDMCIAMAAGKDWMGFKVPKRVKVAYISREDNAEMTRWRMRRLLRTWEIDQTDMDDYFWVNSKEQSPQFKLDVPEQFNEMLAELKVFGPDFVVLDVLNKMHSAEENDNTEMRKVMDKADDLGRELNCSICVIHHFNKETKSRLTERIRGASAMAGWVEWVIGMHKEKEEDDEDTMRWAEFDLKAASPPNNMYFNIQAYDNFGSKLGRGSDANEIYRMEICQTSPPKKGKRNQSSVAE